MVFFNRSAVAWQFIGGGRVPSPGFSGPPTTKMPAIDAVIRVLKQSGTLSHYVTHAEAREMLYGRTAERIGRNCIQYRQGPARPVAGTKYTHARETSTNVQGVVEFRELKGVNDRGEKVWLPRSLFYAVQTSVLVSR